MRRRFRAGCSSDSLSSESTGSNALFFPFLSATRVVCAGRLVRVLCLLVLAALLLVMTWLRLALDAAATRALDRMGVVVETVLGSGDGGSESGEDGVGDDKACLLELFVAMTLVSI